MKEFELAKKIREEAAKLITLPPGEDRYNQIIGALSMRAAEAEIELEMWKNKYMDLVAEKLLEISEDEDEDVERYVAGILADRESKEDYYSTDEGQRELTKRGYYDNV